MSVTTTKLAEELEEILKKTFNFMSEEKWPSLMGLMGEVCELRFMIKQRDQKIELLEQRVDDLEKYTYV